MATATLPTNPRFQNITGHTFWRWTVRSYAGTSKRKHLWNCECECGSNEVVSGSNLASGHSRSCGCISNELRDARFRNLKGEVFGRLSVRSFAGMFHNHRFWTCKCDCGAVSCVDASHLINGGTKSCGCLGDEARQSAITHHGHCSRKRRSPTYTTWTSMINRCTRTTGSGSDKYRAIGIRVCERWRNSFDDFLADMGPRPTKLHSIDRFPNKSGNYEPGNCRWATKAEQSDNRKNTRWVTFAGKTQSIAAWAKDTGLPHAFIYSRIFQYGWSPEKTLTKKSVHHGAPKVLSGPYSWINSLASLISHS